MAHLFSRMLAALALCTAFTTLAAPGDLDTTFGSGTGKVITTIGAGEATARALALQPDGKILVAGSCSNGNDVDLCLARYNTNGALDATFGNGGKVVTYVSDYGDNAYAIAVQPDGKIVVAGACLIVTNNVCLARYNANGVLDATFGTDGIASPFINILDNYANALAIQPDGKLVVAGYCYRLGGSGPEFCLARLSANGDLDPTFGSAGVVLSDLSTFDDIARALALQPDGKILVAGSCSDTFCLARYNADGALDASFGSSGAVIAFSGTNIGQALALLHDGKIVVAGDCFLAGWDFCLARFSANGALDTSFGSSGRVVTPIGSNNDYARALALQPDGKLVVAGHCSNGAKNDVCLARYNPIGSLDTSFNTTGKLISPISASGSAATAVALQPDGKLVVAGYCANGINNDFCLARYEGGPFDARNCSMDIDGDNRVLATTDMLIGARVALGMTGNAVIGGITFASHAKRTTWPAIRDYLVSECGMSIVP